MDTEVERKDSPPWIRRSDRAAPRMSGGHSKEYGVPSELCSQGVSVFAARDMNTLVRGSGGLISWPAALMDALCGDAFTWVSTHHGTLHIP